MRARIFTPTTDRPGGGGWTYEGSTEVGSYTAADLNGLPVPLETIIYVGDWYIKKVAAEQWQMLPAGSMDVQGLYKQVLESPDKAFVV